MEKIFKWFTLREDISLAQLHWFSSKFTNEEFEGVQKVLALFLEYCSFLSVPANRKYLESFLVTEGKKNIKKFNIKLETMDNFDYKEPTALEEACRVIFKAVLVSYDLLVEEDLKDRTFKVDVFEFIQTQKKDRVLQTLAKTFPRATNGEDIDDVTDEAIEELTRIKEIYNVEYIDELDFLTGQQVNEHGTGVMRHLFNTGIPAIDSDTGGMFSKQLWTISSQPGGGKTRYVEILCAYQAAVVHHHGVLITELELTKAEVVNILIAHHIVNLYGGKVKIPDNLINKGKLTAEQKRYVESARIDLFESGDKYGRIIIETKNVIVEKMYKERMAFLKHNRDIELWIVDYAGLMKSKPTGKYSKALIEFEIIAEGCKIMKEVAKDADIGVILVSQFNDKGIQAAYAGKRIVAGHIQGGQIIQRHSDYDIAMCMTEEQELANMRTISTVKKRAAAGFQNVPLSVDLAVSIFRQLKVDATT